MDLTETNQLLQALLVCACFFALFLGIAQGNK